MLKIWKKPENMVRNNYQYFFENEQLKSIATRREAPNDVVQQMLFFLLMWEMSA